jgi:F-type H+-transporting ATPase subunit epsilon
MVVVRTVGGGEVAFLPGHAPFLGALDVGEARIHLTDGGEVQSLQLNGGFVEVSHDKVTILSDEAEVLDA